MFKGIIPITSRMAAASVAHSTIAPIFGSSSIVDPKSILNEMKKENGIQFKFLDASWHLDPSRNAKQEFHETRISEAMFFDIDEISTKSELPHMLPNVEIFNKSCLNLGIVNHQQQHICIYTTKDSFSSARAWWMFKCFGHKNVYVMNGGLPGWINAGGSIESSSNGKKETVNEINTEEDIILYKTLNESLVIDAKQMLDISNNTDKKNEIILDARSSGRFYGQKNNN